MRIPEETLTFERDHLYYHQCKPFTGIAYGSDQSGSFEKEFDQGLENGVSREWFPGGQIREEANLRDGVLHGEYAAYYEGGSLRSKGAYELGVKLRMTEWSESGEIESQYELRPEDPNWATLQKLRLL